jgi:hypothetical protein
MIISVDTLLWIHLLQKCDFQAVFHHACYVYVFVLSKMIRCCAQNDKFSTVRGKMMRIPLTPCIGPMGRVFIFVYFCVCIYMSPELWNAGRDMSICLFANCWIAYLLIVDLHTHVTIIKNLLTYLLELLLIL